MTYMVEEELRRKQETWRPDSIEDNIISILGIDVEKYVKKAEEIKNEHTQSDEITKIQESKNTSDSQILFLMKLEQTNPKALTAKEKIFLAEYRNQGKKTETPENKSMDKAPEYEEEKKSSDEPKKSDKSIQEILEEELKIPKEEFLKGDLMKDLTQIQKKAETHYRELY